MLPGGIDQYCRHGDWRRGNQGLDGVGGSHTIDPVQVNSGLGLTATGKVIAIGFGVINLLLTAGVLSLINWRSRDFNLKKQRRQIRLVDFARKESRQLCRSALSPPASLVRSELKIEN
jgi:hypothetical protein